MEATTEGLLYYTLGYLGMGERVFLVAKDTAHQEYLAQRLQAQGIYKLFLINGTQSIDYSPGDPRDLQVIITTMRHCEGYTLSNMRIMVTGVYFSNQASRSQIEARMNRISNPSPMIRIITVHTGILSYVYENYDKVRTVAECLNQIARLVDTPIDNFTV